MFWLNKRVEEDLKRIRAANVPIDMDAEPENTYVEVRPESEHIGPKDILAMCVAIFSLIGPFLIVILLISALVLFWFFR